MKILNLKFIAKDFDNITTVNTKINQKYTSNHYSDFLVDKNETGFDKLKVRNSKLEICGKDFDNITTVNPKIIQKYTNNHPSDYLMDKNENNFKI